MKLFKRLRTLIAADAHAMLDAIEEPQTLLKQTIRDMALVIDDDKKQLQQINLKVAKLQQNNKLLNQTEIEMNEDLDLCFEQGNHQLSRSIIKKKLCLKQRITFNQQSLKHFNEVKTSLESQLSSHQQQYQKISQQAERLFSQKAIAEENTFNFADPLMPHAITDEDVEIAWLSEKAKRELS